MSGAQTSEQKTHVRDSRARLVLFGIGIVAQVAWLVVLMVRFRSYSAWASFALSLVALVIVLALYGRPGTSASIKMPWFILILALPILGVTLYLLVGLSGSSWAMRRRFRAIDEVLMQLLPGDDGALAQLDRTDKRAANVFRGVMEDCGYPAYSDSDIEFFADTNEALESQLEAMRGAQRYIFMEYHAIEDSESFHRIERVLAEKAAQGVEVRLFYDDVGSIGFISREFRRRMQEQGILCRVFNPVTPILNVFLNNRDHRKITVVDGRVAFTGGYNLADEYFNLTHPYGEWKDSGVRIEGNAVRSFTVMFLEMWNAIKASDKDDVEFGRFFPEVEHRQVERCTLLPYVESPMNDRRTGENAYMNVLNSATRYAYFMSPYLILTDEMARAFELAAKRGVDVRVVIPGVPDKKLVYRMTRSYAANLAQSGVRVYEYAPGFCHTKQCVSDDAIAVCGTINLDYRSLFHHFENAVLFAGCRAVDDMRADFEDTFPQCEEVTQRFVDQQKHLFTLPHDLFKLMAPLL